MFLTEVFSNYIEGIGAYFSGLGFSGHILFVIDILIVGLIIYYALVFIKGTKASKIVYGLVLIIIIAFIGNVLQLQTLNWLLRNAATAIAVAIPVVFQPELRRALEKLGRRSAITRTAMLSNRKIARVVNELIEAIKVLKQNNIGALIVIENKTGLSEYSEGGVRLNANLSSELLLNIFFPKSPLHDGAVIIKQNKIIVAATVLPIAEDRKGYTYGTRHRAALGISEVSDALSIVVSEERGVVSVVIDGKITELKSIDTLEKKLISFLQK